MAKTKLILTCLDYEIPFHDNDMVGIVWHGNYFKYYEMARDKLLARLDLSVPTLVNQYHIGLPVIKSYSRYRQPLTFMDRIKIYASISEYENYLNFDFAIQNASGQVVNEGYTKHAAFDLQKRELLFVVPEFIQKRIQQFAVQEHNYENAHHSNA